MELEEGPENQGSEEAVPPSAEPVEQVPQEPPPDAPSEQVPQEPVPEPAQAPPPVEDLPWDGGDHPLEKVFPKFFASLRARDADTKSLDDFLSRISPKDLEAREAAVLAKEKEYQAREEQAALEKESTRLQTEFPDIWGDPSTEEAPPQLERFVELLGKGLTERQAAVLVRDEFRLAAPAQAVVPSPAKKAETVVPQPEEEVVEPAAVKQKPLPSSVQAMGRPGISPGGLQETAGARDHENLSDYFDRVLYKGRR